MFSVLYRFFRVGLPHLLEVTEGFPESRTDLTQQLHQGVAEEFGSCRFGVKVEGSGSKAINHYINLQNKLCSYLYNNLHKM